MPPVIYERFRREYDTHFASSSPLLRRSIHVALYSIVSSANVLKSRDRLLLNTINKCLTLLYDYYTHARQLESFPRPAYRTTIAENT